MSEEKEEEVLNMLGETAEDILNIKKEDENIYIGITGLAGSGKDTLCDMMMDNVGDHVIVHRIAFADPLKRVTSELYGLPLKAFYDEKGILQNVLGDITTPRKILQHFGTDVMRNMDTNHWVKRFDKEVEDVVNTFQTRDHEFASVSLSMRNYTRKSLKENRDKRNDCEKWSSDRFNVIIIPDVRFENEQQFIKDKNGYLIHIERGELNVGEIDFSHASETSIDKSITMDFKVNNNFRLNKLRLQAVSILNQLGLR